MPIQCKLCGKNFDKIIPWQHLKQSHNITGKDYTKHHGSLISDETRALQQARIPHNRGKKVTDPQHLEKIKQAIQAREQKYERGELTRTHNKHTSQTREKISQAVKSYAKHHTQELSQRAQKANETKKLRGTAQGGMSGKTHTLETKQKISQNTQDQRQARKAQTLQNRIDFLNSLNITVLDVSNQIVICECKTCKFIFTRTFANSNPQKMQHEVCPKCRSHSPRHSTAELTIAQWIKDNTQYQVRVGDRSIISPQELDIYIPELNLAIEYCGLYWHSQESGSKDAHYHQQKWKKCQEQNTRLITVFEDEWLTKPQIVLNALRTQLHLQTQKIPARKCKITALSAADARVFFEKNHIHGYAGSNIRLGLQYQDKLVYAMTFSQKNLSRKTCDWEIQRMAGDGESLVQGGASKLFAEFLRRVDPEIVISYADLRWFTGTSYANLGFVLDSITAPGYWYHKPPALTRFHRFSLRKNKDDNQALSEWENRKQQGWDRIWDCGHAKWIWQKNRSAD